MILFTPKSSNLAKLGKAIDQAGKDLQKSQLNAIKVEGFSLRHTLMQAIRMSAPAPGRRLKELSMIARTVNRKTGLRTWRPLLRIAGGVTYLVDDQAMAMQVGFTRRSPRWAVRAAERQQAGFIRPITDKMRAFIVSRAFERRGKRTWRSRRTGNPLSLRYSTRRFVVPPRPIVAPFWESEKNKSAARVRRNFRLITRGKVAPGGVLYNAQEMANW
jgi:hypothetical protein